MISEACTHAPMRPAGAGSEDIAHVRDFRVTLLRLLGLDDNKLTYYHAGRFKQLSQFGGQPIRGLIA